MNVRHGSMSNCHVCHALSGTRGRLASFVPAYQICSFFNQRSGRSGSGSQACWWFQQQGFASRDIAPCCACTRRQMLGTDFGVVVFASTHVRWRLGTSQSGLSGNIFYTATERGIPPVSGISTFVSARMRWCSCWPMCAEGSERVKDSDTATKFSWKPWQICHILVKGFAEREDELGGVMVEFVA